MAQLNPESISLLWPDPGTQATLKSKLDPQTTRDLDLESIVLAFLGTQEP